MKKLVKNILSFAVFGSLGYLFLLVLWGQFLPKLLNKNLRYNIGGDGFMYSRLTEADTIKNVDVLIIGSSHAYRGYDVRKFEEKGLTAFNLGSSAQTPIQTELLFNKYVKNTKPKLVIFDVYPKVFGLDGVESMLDIISNLNQPDCDISREALAGKNIKVINTLLYSYYRKSIRNETFREKTEREGDKYIEGGYVETFKKSEESKYGKKTEYEILPNQLAAYKRIIHSLKTQKIPFVLLQSPIRKSLYDSFSNNAEIDSLFRADGNYFNFNKNFDIRNEHFADDSHLNQYGVETYNDYLFSILDFKGKK